MVVTLTAICDLPMVRPGDDLAGFLIAVCERNALASANGERGEGSMSRSKIPADSKRILEDRVNKIVERYLSSVTPLAAWLFSKAFEGNELDSVVGTSLHSYRDHTKASDDTLAYGETDIEVIATIAVAGSQKARVGLLIEGKVDARQMDRQGPRYRARGIHRKKVGSWDDFRCILLAPQRYLDSAYPLNNFRQDGWDLLVSLEAAADMLQKDESAAVDVLVLNEAVKLTNMWNKPAPQAVQFWEDLKLFQPKFHRDVPIFIDRQKGAGVNVWPSFYENQLRKNSRELRRKRVQIAWPNISDHISLFIKNVGIQRVQPSRSRNSRTRNVYRSTWGLVAKHPNQSSSDRSATVSRQPGQGTGSSFQGCEEAVRFFPKE